MKKEILSRLILERVKVTWEWVNIISLYHRKVMFWLALPSWLLKVPDINGDGLIWRGLNFNFGSERRGLLESGA